MNTNEVQAPKNPGVISMIASGMFCNSEGKISVVKCLVVAVVIAAIAMVPHILISLMAMVVGGIVLYWIAAGLSRHPAVAELLASAKQAKVNGENNNANTATA